MKQKIYAIVFCKDHYKGKRCVRWLFCSFRKNVGKVYPAVLLWQFQTQASFILCTVVMISPYL